MKTNSNINYWAKCLVENTVSPDTDSDAAPAKITSEAVPTVSPILIQMVVSDDSETGDYMFTPAFDTWKTTPPELPSDWVGMITAKYSPKTVEDVHYFYAALNLFNWNGIDAAEEIGGKIKKIHASLLKAVDTKTAAAEKKIPADMIDEYFDGELRAYIEAEGFECTLFVPVTAPGKGVMKKYPVVDVSDTGNDWLYQDTVILVYPYDDVEAFVEFMNNLNPEVLSGIKLIK